MGPGYPLCKTSRKNENGARIGMKCHIRIKGHLDPCWQDWFEGLTIVQEDEGTTSLAGSLRDQAALYGILAKIRGLGLSLLQLSTSEAVASSESGESF